VDARTFVVVLVLAAGSVGWLSAGLLTAGALTAWLAPQGSAVPALAVLADLTVVIDPGHGGFDPGMLAEEDGRRIRESDINLAVALRLRDILQRAGARVVMTRTTDTDLVRPGGRPVRQSDIKEDLARRVELARRAGADILLSLHCNSFPSSVWRGSQTFYMEDAHQGGRLLAECIQAELARATGETDRTPNGRLQLYMVKNMDAPAVVVELGFLSNPQDRRLLLDPEYQQLLAMAIFFGLCRYTSAAAVSGW